MICSNKIKVGHIYILLNALLQSMHNFAHLVKNLKYNSNIVGIYIISGICSSYETRTFRKIEFEKDFC